MAQVKLENDDPVADKVEKKGNDTDVVIETG